MKKFEKVEKTVFFRANTQISNLNVLHKGLLMQDWVFRLGCIGNFEENMDLSRNSFSCNMVEEGVKNQKH